MKRIVIGILFICILAACGQALDSSDNQEGQASAEESHETTHKTKDTTNNQSDKNDPPEETFNHSQQEDNSKDETENHLTNLKVHYIDAGQADATLFQYAENGKTYTVLYDAGDWNKNDVIHYLKAQQITEIDLIIISHPHADHIGQLAEIMDIYEVKEVWFSGNTASTKTFQLAAEAVLASDATYYEPRAGDIFDVGPLSLEVLHPMKLTSRLNEDSISIRFTYGDVRFLFTGDAYKEEELMMMKNSASVKAQILQLGHHGSDTSSDPAFIKSVNPDVAIYSAAKDNSYGHPHEEIISLMKDQNIKLYGTDIHGTIIITTNGDTYNIETKKEGRITPKSTDEKINDPKDNEAFKDETKESSQTDNCVDINHASVKDIQKIKHIGPTRAKNLIKLRPFQSVDDLSRIKGIGPGRLQDIKNEGIACTGGD